MSYPDVVIACIEHKVSLEAFRAIEAALWSTIIIWRIIPGGWLITITDNHSNYLVCDRANTQSVTVRKVVNCNSITVMPSQLSEFTISSCSEGKNVSSFFITFNWCICSLFLTLVSDGRLQWPRSRNSDPFLLKSDVNLFNHLVRESGCCGCCSAGSALRWHEVAPYSVSLICIVWSCLR